MACVYYVSVDGKGPQAVTMSPESAIHKDAIEQNQLPDETLPYELVLSLRCVTHTTLSSKVSYYNDFCYRREVYDHANHLLLLTAIFHLDGGCNTVKT